MSCTYEYRGHKFKSELELDSFLLESGKYIDTLGDIVFLLTEAASNANSIIETQIKKDSEALEEKTREAISKGKKIYGEDGSVLIIYDKPRVGVTSYLSGLRNSEGVLLFPEFNADDFEENGEPKEGYWSNRYAKWAENNYNEDEKALIFNGEETYPITDPALKQKYRNLFEKKWKLLGEMGTQLHCIPQLFFSKIKSGTNKGKYWYEMGKLLKQQLLSPTNKSKVNMLTETLIDLMIELSHKVLDYVQNTFEGPLTFYPELGVQGEFTNTKDAGANILSGSIDLLVIDKYGVPHIIDYKTSPKPYGEFNSAKRLAYKYLVGVYERLLRKYGLNTHESTFHIAPFQLTNFKFNTETQTAEFKDVIISTGSALVDITEDVRRENIQNNIDEFLPVLPKFNATTDKLLENVTRTMADWYPLYDRWGNQSDEEIKKEIEDSGCLEEDKKNDLGEYVFKKYGKEIKAKDPAELFEKVKRYKESLPKRLGEKVRNIKSILKKGLSKNSETFITSERPFINNDLISSDWFIHHMSKYCTREWEVIDNEAAEALGFILLLNKVSGQYDVVGISSRYLRGEVNFSNPKHTGLAGNFESDVAHAANADDLTLKALNGNVELMQAMLVLNNLQGLFNNPNYYVGEINIFNPTTGDGIPTASNKELLYNFNKLCRYKSPEEGNNFANGNIKMGTKYQIASSLFQEIMTRSGRFEFKDKYYKFSELKPCISMMLEADKAKDPNEKLEALTTLLKYLENNERMRGKFRQVTEDMGESQQAEVRLYNQILLAITELRGIDFKQQTEDSKMWLESLAVHKKGLSGTYIDNPGYLNNLNLNIVTKLVTEAYLNVRQDLVRPRAHLFKLVEAIKKRKGFNGTFSNHAALFLGMMKIEDGDLLFVNPSELATKEERDFLEYVLFTINKNRFNQTDEQIKKGITNGTKSYFRVPLLRGDIQSRASVEGVMGAFKQYMRKWNPKTAWEDAKATAEGIFADADYTKQDYELFKMGTIFDKGEKSDERAKIIADAINNHGGLGYFELNLETLCLKHIFAYSMKDNTDKVFPMMKAAMIHLTTQGHLLNLEFNETKEFLKEYIVNKVKNESIVNKNFRNANALIGSIKSAASKLTLALVPVLFFYQTLQGLWVDIGLMWLRKEYTSVLGERIFTFDNLKAAFLTAYQDLFRNYNRKPSVCTAINQLYGLNDMDMNTYIDKIKSDQGGIWNMTNFLYKFASRPDYYNRLTIFGALMRADGTWEAHSINKETGELEYDIKKDKRFEYFIKGETSNPKYAEQKALFIATAKLFMRENARNIDGTKYILDLNKPNLPRAYTNQLAEAYKALSDNIYGFYSSEKKALLHSTLLGSMWMQMRTYFSGKKNQYLGHGGVKLLGRMIHYKEKNPDTGLLEPLYYQYDAEGNLTDIIGFTPTDAPVMRWEGEWQEGILLTIADCASISPKLFWQNVTDKWYHEDERLRNAYRANFRKTIYDLIMFAVLGPLAAALMGDWLDELKEDSKDSNDVIDGLKISAANIAVKSIQNSFMDFNFFQSVGGPAAQWTPFSIEWGSRVIDTWSTALGDGDFWDAMVNTSNATKNFKPFFDTIKPDIFKPDRK